MDEEIEVLTKSGKKTGKVMNRHQIHDKEIDHEVVHIWIVDKDDNLLIQWRSPEKSQYASVWHMSSAGHISFGETALTAAEREMEEEIGVKLAESDFIFLRRLKVAQRVPESGLMDNEWVCDYLVKLDQEKVKFKLQKEEVGKVKWISLDEFKKEIKNPKIYKNYLNHPQIYYLSTLKLIKERLD